MSRSSTEITLHFVWATKNESRFLRRNGSRGFTAAFSRNAEG